MGKRDRNLLRSGTLKATPLGWCDGLAAKGSVYNPKSLFCAKSADSWFLPFLYAGVHSAEWYIKRCFPLNSLKFVITEEGSCFS